MPTLPGMVALALAGLCAAASDLETIPPLRAARPEIGPGFWEQHGLAMIVSGTLLLLLLGVVVWFVTRPRPGAAISPETQARKLLNSLKTQPPDGATLSRATQALRGYLVAVLRLPAGEMTTSEFCAALGACENISQALSSRICRFLRQSDEQKFAPHALMSTASPAQAGAIPNGASVPASRREEISPPLAAVDEALHLVGEVEEHFRPPQPADRAPANQQP